MANSFIKDLTQVNLDNSNDFYIPGIKGDSNNLITDTKKFNFSIINTKINKIINSLEGDLEEFDSNKNYFCGEYVIYNSKVYRFTKDHISSPWSNEDSKEVVIFDELGLLDLNKGDSELVNINITSDDEILSTNDLILNVVISDSIMFSIQYSSMGNYSFNIPKGLEYTIKFPQIPGYFPVEDLVFESELDERIINIVYYSNRQSSTNNSVSLKFSIFGNYSNMDILKGKTCTIYSDSNYTYYSAVIDNNNSAIFQNIPCGEYKTLIPNVSDYKSPINKSFIIDNDSNITLEFQYKYTLYTLYTSSISELSYIYLVTTDFNEYNLDTLFDHNNEWIGTEKYGINPNNTLAFHVRPEMLMSKKCDFFVKPYDLMGGGYTTSSLNYQPLGTNNNVILPDYLSRLSNRDRDCFINGKKNTYDLLLHSRLKGIDTLGGFIWTNNQVLRYRDLDLHGFVGSLSQLIFIVSGNKRNYHPHDFDRLYSTCVSLGYYTPGGRYYLNNAGFITTSTLGMSGTNSGFWSRTYVANNEFSVYTRTYRGYFIPFFSPY